MHIGFLNNIGYTFLTYLLTYVSGHLIFSLTSKDSKPSAQTEFIKNVLGACCIVILYSFFKTHLITINSGFVLLFLFYFLYHRPVLKPVFRLDVKSIAIQLLLLTILYTLLYFLLFGIKERPYIWLMVDHTIYATYIDKLNIIGAEGIQSNLFFKEPLRNLYHYGELWYCAFFTALFRHNTLQVFYFAVFPNFLLMIVLGGKAIAEFFFEKSVWYHWGLAFLMFILAGIVFYFPSSIPFFSLSWGNDTILSNIKYAPITILLIWVFLCLFRKEYYNTVLLLLSVLLINTSTAPAILMALVLFIGALLLIKEISINTAYRLTLPIGFIVVFIAAYALFIGVLNKQFLSSDISFEKDFSVTSQLKDILYYKTLFNCTAGTMIKFALSTLPFFGLLLFGGKLLWKKYLSVTLFAIILTFTSALSYGIFHFDFDGTQFWTTVYIPLMAVFLFFILVSVNACVSSVSIKIYSVFLILLLLYPYIFSNKRGMNFKQYTASAHYLTDNIHADNTREIAVFYPKSKPNHVAGYDKNNYYPYNYIKLYINNYHPYCLSEFDTLLSEDPYISSYQQKYLKRSLFYRYVEKQKKQNTFVSIEHSQLDFIKEARVKYILTQAGATLPGLIMPFVEKEIKDTLSPSSMDMLYILKDFK